MAANNGGFPVSGAGATSNSSNGSAYEIHHSMYNNSPNYDYDYDAILNNNNNNSLLDYSSVLKHDTGLAVEWSVDEQCKLEQGLAKYSNEPRFMRYIKVAALLHDKTIRDVALRCSWMNRKRRKPGDQSLGKKLKDHKDELMESTLNNAMSSASLAQVPPCALATNFQRPSDYMLPGVLSCTTRHLLEENNQAFGQISANISSLKLQENIDLFSQTRNNISTILDDMRNTTGIMSQMPPLPVLLNEDLATSIYLHPSQIMMFGSSSSIPLKQEPGC